MGVASDDIEDKSSGRIIEGFVGHSKDFGILA